MLAYDPKQEMYHSFDIYV